MNKSLLLVGACLSFFATVEAKTNDSYTSDLGTKVYTEEVEGYIPNKARIGSEFHTPNSDLYIVEEFDNFKKTDMKIYGEAHLSNGTVKRNLEIVGSLLFKNFRSEGNAVITGPISHSKHGYFRNLKVLGPVNMMFTHVAGNLDVTGWVKLNQVKVSGNTNIIGSLKAKDSNLVHDLTVSGSSVKLKNSHVKNIHFKSHHSNAEMKQVLHLTNGSVVNGMIRFDSGNGHVIDETGTIKQVQVQGGTIELRK